MGWLGSNTNILTLRTPKLNTSGFFVFKRKEIMNIDYSKLNDRIVKQAYMILDKAQVKQLVEGKIQRAQAELKAREAIDK